MNIWKPYSGSTESEIGSASSLCCGNSLYKIAPMGPLGVALLGGAALLWYMSYWRKCVTGGGL